MLDAGRSVPASSLTLTVLVEAGARIEGIEVAAAVGDVTEWLAGAAPDAMTRALVMAARHERLDVIDGLLARGMHRRRRQI